MSYFHSGSPPLTGANQPKLTSALHFVLIRIASFTFPQNIQTGVIQSPKLSNASLLVSTICGKIGFGDKIREKFTLTWKIFANFYSFKGLSFNWKCSNLLIISAKVMFEDCLQWYLSPAWRCVIQVINGSHLWRKQQQWNKLILLHDITDHTHTTRHPSGARSQCFVLDAKVNLNLWLFGWEN